MALAPENSYNIFSLFLIILIVLHLLLITMLTVAHPETFYAVPLSNRSNRFDCTPGRIVGKQIKNPISLHIFSFYTINRVHVRWTSWFILLYQSQTPSTTFLRVNFPCCSYSSTDLFSISLCKYKYLLTNTILCQQSPG